MAKQQNKKILTWIVVGGITAILVLTFVGVMIGNFVRNREIKSFNRVSHLVSAEIFDETLALNKSGYYVLIYASGIPSSIDDKLFEYLTLVMKNKKSQYALPMYCFDIKAYPNGRYIYYADVDNVITGIKDISELKIIRPAVPILVLFDNKGQIKQTVYLNKDIELVINNQIRLINNIK